MKSIKKYIQEEIKEKPKTKPRLIQARIPDDLYQEVQKKLNDDKVTWVDFMKGAVKAYLRK